MSRKTKRVSHPNGKTCEDCVHFQDTCEWLIQCKPSRRTCDWEPSKFYPIFPEKKEDMPCHPLKDLICPHCDVAYLLRCTFCRRRIQSFSSQLILDKKSYVFCERCRCKADAMTLEDVLKMARERAT